MAASLSGISARRRARARRGRCAARRAAWSTANSLSSRTSMKWKRSPRSSRACTSATVHCGCDRARRPRGQENRGCAACRLRLSLSLVPVSSVRTEGLLRSTGRQPRRRRRRAEAGLPQARHGAAPRPQSGRQARPRRLQGGVRGLPGPVRPREARATTTASGTRAAAPAWAASATSTTSSRRSPTSSATCSAAAGGGGRRGARRAARTSRRAWSITLEEAFTGVTKRPRSLRRTACGTCKGTGAAPGHVSPRPASAAAGAARSCTRRAS